MGNKEVDAVGLVRQIRDNLYEETKNLSAQELVKFYHSHSEAARERLSKLQEEQNEVRRRA